jgi:hypothetical protein
LTAVKKPGDQLPDCFLNARGKISIYVDGYAVTPSTNLHALP